MIKVFTITCDTRTVEFRMDLDPSSPSDAAIAYYLEHGSPPEPELVHLMSRVLHEGDTFVDGGANLGFFSLLASKYVGPTGKVIAIEPGANNLDKLVRNIQLNGSSCISIVTKPLWSIATDIDFYLYQDSGGNACWPYDKGSIPGKLASTTLNQVCEGEIPKLIKLDIEGAEVDALLGANDVLDRQVPYWVVEMNVTALEHMGTTPEAMRDIMLSYGYSPFLLNPGGLTLPTLVPDGCALKPQRMNSNMLFSTVAAVAQAWPEAAW